MNDHLQIADTIRLADFQPGTKTWVRKTFTTHLGRSFCVSVGILQGAQPGPVFTNVAGQHGMEHTGPIVLRDLFDELDPAAIHGTLLLCPCANPLALELDFEIFPEFEDPALWQTDRDLSYSDFGYEDRNDLGAYNLNRIWPPSEDNRGVAGQIAQWLWPSLVEPADLVLDHHGLNALKPLVYAENPVVDWGPLLGTEAIWCTGWPADPDAYPYRRLGFQAIRAGKPGLIIEYATQHTVREHERRIGHFAVKNMMRALGMLRDKPPTIRRPTWLLPGHYWTDLVEVTTEHRGHLHFFVNEYQPLKKGDLIAQVRCLQTHDVLHELRAETDCLMLDRMKRAVTRPGDRVCRVHPLATLKASPDKPYDIPQLAGNFDQPKQTQTSEYSSIESDYEIID